MLKSPFAKTGVAMARRLAMYRTAIAGAAIFVGISMAGPARAQSDNPCKSGAPAIITMSDLAPKGSMAGFNKAVADHQKWYADHGLKDKIFAAPVLVFDRKTRNATPSPNKLMTFHLNSTTVPDPKNDAAWNAYVAEYRANSKITSTTVVCYPN